MIVTLLVTILIEGVVVLAYCIWQRKPLLSILLTSIAANVITQALLWMVLLIFFRYYVAVLLIMEILIWLFESILIYAPQKNELTPKNALLLSLCMNLLSFGVGWFLPL